MKTDIVETVYDITVEDDHSFTANRAIVHNCTEFSTAQDFHKENDIEKGMFLVNHCLRIIEETNPVFWLLENPANGKLKDVIGKPAHIYQPWQYGSPWTKKTALWNLEMPFFTLLMGELKKALKKSLKAILSSPPTEEEKPIYKKVADEFRDPRLTKIDETLDPQEFYEVTKAYTEENRDKKQLFIILDHIGIIKGVNKTESIYQTMEYMNKLKLEYPGLLTFIVLGQLNREIENRWRSKDTNPFVLFPDSSSLFASDSCMFFGDIVLAQVIPQNVGMDKYGVINRERNPHLEDHIVEEDKASPKDYVRLKGHNRIYYHYLKVRLQDGEPTTYCQILDEEQEEFNTAVSQYEKDHTQQEEYDDLAF